MEEDGCDGCWIINVGRRNDAKEGNSNFILDLSIPD